MRSSFAVFVWTRDAVLDGGIHNSESPSSAAVWAFERAGLAFGGQLLSPFKFLR
jgi:hypothetical protein